MKSLGDKFIIANALCNLGLFASYQNNLEQAHSYLEQGLEIFSELDSTHKRDLPWPLIYMGEEAKEFFQESKNILKEVGDRLTLAGAVRRLGQIALHKGDVEAAIAACTESLNLNMEAGDHRGVLACLSAFAGIALERGQTKAAVQLFGAVQTLLSAMNFRLLQIDHIEFEHNLAALRKQLDQPSLERVWAKGEVMTKEQAIEFALNLVK